MRACKASIGMQEKEDEGMEAPLLGERWGRIGVLWINLEQRDERLSEDRSELPWMC